MTRLTSKILRHAQDRRDAPQVLLPHLLRSTFLDDRLKVQTLPAGREHDRFDSTGPRWGEGSPNVGSRNGSGGGTQGGLEGVVLRGRGEAEERELLDEACAESRKVEQREGVSVSFSGERGLVERLLNVEGTHSAEEALRLTRASS